VLSRFHLRLLLAWPSLALISASVRGQKRRIALFSQTSTVPPLLDLATTTMHHNASYTRGQQNDTHQQETLRRFASSLKVSIIEVIQTLAACRLHSVVWHQGETTCYQLEVRCSTLLALGAEKASIICVSFTCGTHLYHCHVIIVF
jgi:hypothetical protein